MSNGAFEIAAGVMALPCISLAKTGSKPILLGRDTSDEAEVWTSTMLLQAPTVLIPLLLAPPTGAGLMDSASAVTCALLVVAAACGGMASLLGWQGESEKHFAAAYRYFDMHTDVEEILSRAPRFRPRCDVVISRFKMRMDSAQQHSPVIDQPKPKYEALSGSDSEV
jgi:hypothetical protein